MIIDCISDLHGTYPDLEGGDLLIISGDITARDYVYEWGHFFIWLSRQQYRKKILVAGNHDGILVDKHPAELGKELCGFRDDTFEYLCDSGTIFEGYKIWGSPWTPVFFDWHFMLKRGKDIREKWDLIPPDTDFLVTHGPPFGKLDFTERRFSARGKIVQEHCGCEQLAQVINLIKPKLHVFGHIHEGYGVKADLELKTVFVNCSLMDMNYNSTNKPIRLNFD